ncbi:hypothetical protein [uncultured Gemmiger sp.]|nr:hypothetical protein [uncultured Gemmiger sp.]
MNSFLSMFLAAFLGQGFVLVVRFLIEAIVDYRNFRNAESTDSTRDET